MTEPDPRNAASSWRRRIPVVLRAMLLAAVAGLVWIQFRPPVPQAGRAAGEAFLRWNGQLDSAAPRPGDTRPLVRVGTAPPTDSEIDALEAAAEQHPLIAALPPRHAVRFWAAPPAQPRAGWPATLPFRVYGPPGDSVEVRLTDEQGTARSLRVALSAKGEAAGGFRVVASRPGWAEWRVAAGAAEQRIGAWIAPADSLRVLVAAGPPSWESKFVVQALEEAGVAVALVQPLADGLDVGGAPREIPSNAEQLAGYGAVLLLSGAAPSPVQRQALRTYTAGGGGVLNVGAGAPLLAAAESTAGVARTTRAQAIRWSLPAELAPLPPADFAAPLEPLGRRPASAMVAATAPPGDVLLLLPYGRGRAAALALTETWQWRMLAGQTEAHRDFWASLARWLAGAPRAGATVRLDRSIGPTDGLVSVSVFAGEAGEAPPRLVLRRPSGAPEPLPLQANPLRRGVWSARFIPHERGLYRVQFDGATTTAFRAVSGSTPAQTPWATLALLAHRSGGAALPAASLPPLLAEFRVGGAERASRVPWTATLFALVIGLALAEWAIRRFTGRR